MNFISTSFAKKIVLKLLSNFEKGRMVLIDEQGKEHVFGKEPEGISVRIRVTNDGFWKRVMLFADIGFAESYMLGQWETEDITQVIKWMIANIEYSPAITGGSRVGSFLFGALQVFNRWYHNSRPNTISGSKKNIVEHYDLGNKFYQLWLDPTLTYSSGLFEQNTLSLEQAQIQKYDRLCKELKIQKGDKVLEIGSGWGGFSAYAVKNYGCEVTTITISNEQFAYASQKMEKEGIADKVKVLLKDYRHLEGKFDKIVSIEMLEAVGHKFLKTYFEQCSKLLNKDGILGIQVIISPDSRYDQLRKGVDFIQKHIFPGSLLPSVKAMNTAINQTSDLTLYGMKEMGLSYAKTLKMWRENFNEKLNEVKALGFDDQFIRKWNYYLSYCEAAFETRNINVVQLIYARPNNSII
jgi:cyclopropane-fatty-acyl-phospholipid synthase